MNLQEILADLAAQVRRPGFWQSAAGQLAIAAGSTLVRTAADEAEERALEASKYLDSLNQAIDSKGDKLRALVVEAIEDGTYDDHVIARAQKLGYITVEEAASEATGPVGVYEEQNGSDHGEAYATAPNGKADTPPRMAGGYLASIAPTSVEPHDWAGSGCRGVGEVHWPACTHRPDSRVCQHEPCDECQTPAAVVADDREHAD